MSIPIQYSTESITDPKKIAEISKRIQDGVKKQKENEAKRKVERENDKTQSKQ